MTLEAKIQSDLITFMKAKDSVRTDALKMLRAAMIKERTKEGRVGGKDKPLEESEIIGLVRKEVKTRQDSIAEFEKAGRMELVEKERTEITALRGYLPVEMGDDELRALVATVVAEFAPDRGKMIRETIARAGGRIDGKRASSAVAAALAPAGGGR